MKYENEIKDAIRFLVERNPLEDCTPPHIFKAALQQFTDFYGEKALFGLAGFYCYIKSYEHPEKQYKALRQTFLHDLSGAAAKDKWMLPWSSSYVEFWKAEYYHELN